MNELQYSDEMPDTLLEYLEEQDLNEKQLQVKDFHHWLRNYTELSSGVVFSYVKTVHALIDKHGSIEAVPKTELGQRQTSAYNKYAEYLEDTDKTSKSKQGEK